MNKFKQLWAIGFFNAFVAGFLATMGTFFLLGGSYGLGAAMILLAVLNILLGAYSA